MRLFGTLLAPKYAFCTNEDYVADLTPGIMILKVVTFAQSIKVPMRQAISVIVFTGQLAKGLSGSADRIPTYSNNELLAAIRRYLPMPLHTAT